MKTLLSWKTLAVAMTVALLCAAPLAAQTAVLRVEVPFAFTAGTEWLPAGEYRVSVDSEHMFSIIAAMDGTNRCVVRLTPGDGSRPAAALDKGLLRFEKYGQRYILSGIWRAGGSEGNSVARPRPPKELAGKPVVQDVAESR